ncbi:serine/threonine-protein kinase [Streptosporangium sp. NPDC023615]|uniref:serine/threonine-protein kinase n=1 Tax=Streptosporangium sp. NPDC023615 TaxID=3154794 RepID=UPI00342969B6
MRPLEHDDPRWVGTGDRRYRVLARIGSGGMGTVYLGRSAGGRAVAIKMVRPELAEDREFRRRFRREVMVARAVGGAYAVAVLDADPAAEVPWLASEFLPSVSLDEAVRDAGALPAGTVWALAAGMAEALRSIHGAGIVHRDLKPANVLLTADGPRLIDFGIARAVDAATITRPGTRTGSPGFMSPEQIAGDTTGPAADVFSFGATLVFARTGAEPFGEGPWHVRVSRVRTESPRLDEIAEDDLRALIASCMDLEPGRRPTADGLIDRIAALRHDGPGRAYALPAPVAAAIGRRAGEAENPPLPRDGGTGTGTGGTARGHRRSVWAGAGALLTVLVAVIVVLGGAGRPPVAGPGVRDDAAPAVPTGVLPGTGTGATPGVPALTVTPAAPAPSAARGRQLEFHLTGDVRLISVTYTVDGRSKTLKDVKLPWRKTIEIPKSPDINQWRIRFRFPAGAVRWRVLVDGFEAGAGNSSSTLVPSRGGGDGAV